MNSFYLKFTVAALALLCSVQGAHAQFTSSGTGFFVSPDGLMLTADHLVKGKSRIAILLDGRLNDADLIKEDEANDLALIKIERSPVPFLKLGKSENIPVGIIVFTVGYPQLNIQGMAPKFTMGIINSDKGLKGDSRYFQFSAPIQKGNSGGPLLAPDNTVIGIVESKLGSISSDKGEAEIMQNVNYALKSSFATALVSQYPSIPRAISVNPKQEREPYEVFRDARQAIAPVLTSQ